MNLPSEWTLFLNLVDDLLNECESRMYCQDFRVLEGLLERLHGVRNGCNRVANPGGGYSINYWVGMCRWDSETLSLY